MAIAVTIAVLATLGVIGWLIYRAVSGRQVKAHHITYGIAVVTGIFTYAYFLSMHMPPLIKIAVSIILGILLIVLAAFLERRRQPGKA